MTRSAVVIAHGDGRRVVVADAHGPVLRVGCKDGAVGAELVDQSCRIRRSGQLDPAFGQVPPLHPRRHRILPVLSRHPPVKREPQAPTAVPPARLWLSPSAQEASMSPPGRRPPAGSIPIGTAHTQATSPAGTSGKALRCRHVDRFDEAEVQAESCASSSSVVRMAWA
jgi:hypothetical protein